MDPTRTPDADTTDLDTDAAESDEAARHINSVDATSGQPIVARVLARKAELEALLDGLLESDVSTQRDIYHALATINDLLTGDLDNIPSVVAVDMNRWLERHKHLGERAARHTSADEAPVTA